MRKRERQIKLSRSTAHRKALLRNLSQELIKHGQIKTTLAKAKALRPFVERIITKTKQQETEAIRSITRVIYDREIVEKLVKEVGPKYVDRPGGYTRIIKLGPRQGDGVEEAMIQLVND